VLFSSDNDDLYQPEIFNAEISDLAAGESIIQMQIPYSATVEIKNKLTALELSNYIIAKQSKDRYLCEFHSIEKFIGILLSLDSDFRLIEPYWLRERLVRNAKRVLSNNSDIEEDS
jgi:predicted DNA-binding transcriptional regulator YafY